MIRDGMSNWDVKTIIAIAETISIMRFVSMKYLLQKNIINNENFFGIK